MIRRLDTNWVCGFGDRVTLYLTKEAKWDAPWNGEEEEIRYKGVEAFEVISGKRATELEERTDIDEDELHEYLRIYLKNGETATFRNSHATLFCI